MGYLHYVASRFGVLMTGGLQKIYQLKLHDIMFSVHCSCSIFFTYFMGGNEAKEQSPTISSLLMMLC